MISIITTDRWVCWGRILLSGEVLDRSEVPGPRSLPLSPRTIGCLRKQAIHYNHLIIAPTQLNAYLGILHLYCLTSIAFNSCSGKWDIRQNSISLRVPCKATNKSGFATALGKLAASEADCAGATKLPPPNFVLMHRANFYTRQKKRKLAE